MSALLPAEFADLEPLAADWALPDETSRYRRRLASSMEEIQAFYDAVTPRVPAARDYLDRFELADLPPEAQRLLWLLFSLICVSFAVEVWSDPKVPDTGVAAFERVIEPATYPV
jgi:hypothetical protein